MSEERGARVVAGSHGWKPQANLYSLEHKFVQESASARPGALVRLQLDVSIAVHVLGRDAQSIAGELRRSSLRRDPGVEIDERVLGEHS